MKDRISQWEERYEAFSLRERGLIFAAVVVLMSLAWDAMVLSPQEVKQKNIVSEMLSVNQQLEGISTQVNVITKKLRGGETQRVQMRIDELQGLLSDLKHKQQRLAIEFIQPEQMATVLRDMLSNETKLTLIRLESLGVEPLFPSQEISPSENTQEKRPNIYKHGMRVELEGDFNSTLNYLQALESMPWRFYWDNVEYQVLDYPVARVVITVHTLSLDEGWIGV
ncbi:MAG: hypothetical protein GXP19_09720 [Gammaproteobacteria bacterium]|nr:hypothetical protein [Gammaproteobacteria bacterium]